MSEIPGLAMGITNLCHCEKKENVIMDGLLIWEKSLAEFKLTKNLQKLFFQKL